MKTYFKSRQFLNFSPHRYDIGNPFGSWHKYENNHFLGKINKLNPDEFADFYAYHLAYVLEHTSDTEVQFLAKVWGFVENHIRYLNRKDPYKSFYKIAQAWVEKLEVFQEYLNSIDQ